MTSYWLLPVVHEYSWTQYSSSWLLDWPSTTQHSDRPTDGQLRSISWQRVGGVAMCSRHNSNDFRYWPATAIAAVCCKEPQHRQDNAVETMETDLDNLVECPAATATLNARCWDDRTL